jgi:hypothetical protein
MLTVVTVVVLLRLIANWRKPKIDWESELLTLGLHLYSSLIIFVILKALVHAVL